MHNPDAKAKRATHPGWMWTLSFSSAQTASWTFAWYGHLKYKEVALWKLILRSWSIALFESCLQVPANRIGFVAFSCLVAGAFVIFNKI